MKTKNFTLLVIATMFATQCLYAYDALIDGIAYNLNEAELTAGVTQLNYPNKYSGDVTIPATVNYLSKKYSVTRIGSSAFFDCKGLTSINIPNSVISIGESAFYYCKGLTSINIPNSVTSIGESAFYNCTGLTSINIPNSVTSIGKSAFSRCTGLPVIDNIRYADTYLVEAVDITLPSYTIKNGTKWIGEEAFDGCTGLTSINIPNSVTSIGYVAFGRCSILNSIVVESGNPVFDSRNNCNAIIESSANTLIIGCNNTTIPNSVTSIGELAFYGCTGLTSINIPNSVTSIGASAFSECTGLTSINIPNSVTSIGISAFYECTGLTSINIPNSVTSIGIAAFCNCTGLTSINIPNNVTSIGSSAFSGCTYLQNLTLPSTLRTIGDNSFAKCEKLAGLRCAAVVPPTIYAKTFEYVDRTIPVIVPQGSLKAYKEDMYWSEFVNLQEETTDAKEIPAEFENVSVTDGTVTYSGEKPFCIHNLNGQDVTNLNGSLNGIHVVTIGTASQNMLIK